MYKITKIDSKGKEYNYGWYCEEDKNLIIKGWKYNGLFYEKRNTKSIIIVDEKEI